MMLWRRRACGPAHIPVVVSRPAFSLCVNVVSVVAVQLKVMSDYQLLECECASVSVEGEKKGGDCGVDDQ